MKNSHSKSTLTESVMGSFSNNGSVARSSTQRSCQPRNTFERQETTRARISPVAILMMKFQHTLHVHTSTIGIIGIIRHDDINWTRSPRPII